MSNKTLTTLTIATTLASMLALSGCAHRRPPADPAAVQQQETRTRRLKAEDAPDPNAAKLTFTSSGMPMGVMFWKSTSTQACSGFEPVGHVFHSGREVLLPGIANLTEKLNKALLRNETSREQYLQPGVPVQVKGLFGAEVPDRHSDSCGPIVTSFIPEPGRKYSVNFAFHGRRSCSQSVVDITDQDHPSPVGRPVACPKRQDYLALENAKKNFLEAEHERQLEDARQQEAAATSDEDKASAMKKEAAALDSLGRSKEALQIIDRAMGLAKAGNNRDLIATKAGILFALDDPQAALTVLAPEIDNMRKRAASQSAAERAMVLGTYTEGFVTATFAHIQLEQWRDAIDTLADAQSPLEGSSFLAYRAVLYRYIMTRAQNPSLANAALERDAAYYAEHDSGHYGALLRMWRGDGIRLEMTAILSRMSGVDQQEARGEVLFYEGAYLKFVKGNAVRASSSLAELNQLAPYGSIEWIYGRRMLH
jgi:tetratricopeptide (TPR) repeat protein